MRLPSRPHGARSRRRRGRRHRPDRRRLARPRARPMIVVAGHVGNNEAVGAALAGRGLPGRTSIADDSSFPELFELLRRQREAWGVHVIPWRNLRELFTRAAAQRDPGAARGLGLPRRRHPRAAVRRLDDAAGRPGHAGREDRRDHRAARDPADGGRPVPGRAVRAVHRAVVGPGRPPARDPADRRRPRATIAAAPEQWYSFKPMWPTIPPRRASSRPARPRCSRADAAGDAGAGGRRDRRDRRRRPPDRRPAPPRAEAGGSARRCGARCVVVGGRASLAALPEAPARRRRRGARRALVPRLARAARAQARANLRACLRGAGRAGPRPAARPARGHGSGRPRAPRPRRVPARRPLLPRGRADRRLRRRDRPRARSTSRRPTRSATRCRPGGRSSSSGMHFGAIELPAIVARRSLVGHRVTAPMETVADPALQRWFVSSRSRVGVDIVPLATPAAPCSRALRRGESVGHRRRPRPHRQRHPGPVLRPPGADLRRPGAARARDRRAGLRRRRAAATGGRYARPADPGPVAGRRDAPRARRSR